MIKSITVTNPSGEALTLELMRPEKSGFIVKETDGLGPTSATINMTDIATIPGSIYSSSHQSRRDIVLNLEFMDFPERAISIEDIRHKSYEFFPTGGNVHLRIETDRRIVETDGYVQANEPDIFTQNAGCSVTINCEDAYLYDVTDQVTSFSGVVPAFSFPFSNNLYGMSEEPLNVTGEILMKNEEIVRYEGDAEMGMIINIHAVGEAKNIIIHNITAGKQMRIDTMKIESITGSGILEGDTIVLDTRDRHRTVTLIRNGERFNILNCLKRGTPWLTLKKGDNILMYEAESGSSNLKFNITNKIAYLGV